MGLGRSIRVGENLDFLSGYFFRDNEKMRVDAAKPRAGRLWVQFAVMREKEMGVARASGS